MKHTKKGSERYFLCIHFVYVECDSKVRCCDYTLGDQVVILPLFLPIRIDIFRNFIFAHEHAEKHRRHKKEMKNTSKQKTYP